MHRDAACAASGYIDKAEIQMMLETLGLKNVTSVMVGDTLKEIEKVATSWCACPTACHMPGCHRQRRWCQSAGKTDR